MPTAGHLGTDKTYYKVSQSFWFPEMYSKVNDYYKKCKICDKNRRFFKINDLLHPIEVNEPMEF